MTRTNASRGWAPWSARPLTKNAGVPVTHRDTNHAVTFITGHGVDGALTKLDWNAVSRGAPTLVFYMGRRFAGEIAAALMAEGRKPDEPAAIVANAARPDQQVTVTTLSGPTW